MISTGSKTSSGRTTVVPPKKLNWQKPKAARWNIGGTAKD